MDAMVAATDAALRLVAVEGVAALTQPAVDAVAGLAPGTCARLFPDRARFLQSVLQRGAAPLETALLGFVDATDGHPVRCAETVIRHLRGPAREPARAMLCLLLDPGVRRCVGLYADALLAGCIRRFAAEMGLSAEDGTRWIRMIVAS
jgi:hypothetical protein